MKKRKCWWYTAGEAPFTVAVHERTPGGVLYVRMFDPTVIRRSESGKVRRGAQVRESLGHRDREAARLFAEEEARKLRAGAEAMTGRPTVAGVLQLYLIHRTPEKASTATRKDDKRRAEMFTLLYGSKLVGELTDIEWNEFKQLRASGAINAKGEAVAPADRVEVGPRAVDADLVFIIAVFNWATGFKVKGRRLIDGNPFGAPAPGVKRTLERPKNRAPKRPIATWDRFLKVRKTAERVMMEAREGDPGATLVKVGDAEYRHGRGPVMKWMKPSYLPELLDLVEETGRRVSAICRLWYSDFIREGGEVTKIRWRPFKQEDEKIVPIPKRSRAAVKRILARRPGVGDVPVFPATRRSKNGQPQSINRHTAADWLQAAEGLAGVEHLDGGAFHPYRRKWATERKHLPDADVMAVGGWKDSRSLKESYQHADDETMLAVVHETRKLRTRKA